MTKGRELHGKQWNAIRQKVYGRQRWKRVRRAVLDRDGWRCSACGRAGRLEVHHVKRVSEEPDGAGWYDPDNLRVLCRSCHFAQHRPEKREAGRAHMSADRQEWRAVLDGITDREKGDDGTGKGNPA